MGGITTIAGSVKINLIVFTRNGRKDPQVILEVSSPKRFQSIPEASRKHPHYMRKTCHTNAQLSLEPLDHHVDYFLHLDVESHALRELLLFDLKYFVEALVFLDDLSEDQNGHFFLQTG